jgi:CDP-diacylglycerol---serine O-phosphatidyltransferase
MTARQDNVSLRQLLPNLVTIIGLCSGLTAIRFVLLGELGTAAALILLAAVMDALDGLLARRLEATSSFGAEIDSLSDFVCFGVAPSLVIYQFALSDVRGLGWVFVLVYAVCACLRLARFNITRDVVLPGTTRPHFVGVPAPGAALLALLPIFLAEQGFGLSQDLSMSIGVYLATIGLLMICHVATPSIKALNVPKDKAVWVLVGVAAFVGLAVTRFWLLMCVLGIAYLAVIGWSIVRHLRGIRP